MFSKQIYKIFNDPINKWNSIRKILKLNYYTVIDEVNHPKNVRVIDYRSDTFSKPSQEMRRVMYEAKVGDDVYGEDPTVNELERKTAKMFGKEAALFVASGTMANLLAIMTHSNNRGCEVIVGDESHILLMEQAGAAQIAGAQLRTVVNKPNGTFDLNEMLCKVRKAQMFLPKTSLVCVENTHNSCGGRVLPYNWLIELGNIVKDLNIPLHMDGARFFNSVIKTGLPAHEIVKDCDSINVCLSKGLGAPIGSLLIGSEMFVQKARHLRKVLGGGMRQVGLMAAAGIYALDNMVARLKEDHDHAYTIAKAIHDMNSKVVTVDLEAQETNILLINLDKSIVNSNEFCKRLLTVTDEELNDDMPTAVKVLPWTENIVRLVVCCNNSPDEAHATNRKMRKVINEYDESQRGSQHLHATS